MSFFTAVARRAVKEVERAIASGADVDLPMTFGGKTPLMCVVDHDATLQLLLKVGATVDLTDRVGLSALHYAAAEGFHGALQLLLANGADIDRRDRFGRSPLALAAGCGSARCVRLLLDAGAALRGAEGEEWCGSPAVRAACGGHREVLDVLFERGVGVDARDPDGTTAILGAARGRHYELVGHLLDLGAGVRHVAFGIFRETALSLCVTRSAPLELVRRLVARGADVQHRATPRQKTVLALAAHCGRADIVGLLLEHGAADLRDDGGKTALHEVASREGGVDVAALLVGNGADVNAADDTGATPLMMAIQNDSRPAEMIEYLCAAGAALDAADAAGQTALVWAAMYNSTQAIRTLVRLGARLPDADSGLADVLAALEG